MVARFLALITSLVAVCGNSLVASAAPPDIYIDSFPQGAEVRLLPKKGAETTQKDTVLGRTPLTLKAQAPTMRFSIVMNMKDYLAKVDTLPEMKEWVGRFKSAQHFDGNPYHGSRLFNFDTAESIIQSRGEEIIAIGPVYELNWPRQNRLCALFIPRSIKVSAFYPLMPQPGTYPRLGGTWPEKLQNQYKFSDTQARDALDTLSRVGKYVTVVRDPFRKGMGRQFSLTVQGPGNDASHRPLTDLQVTTVSYEIQIIPGFND